MNAISPGSRVMLGSGLFGTVVAVGPRQVVLEISPGAEVTVLKQAISRVVTDDDEDRLDEQDGLDEEGSAWETAGEPPIERPWADRDQAGRPVAPLVPKRSPTPRDSKPPTAD